MAIPGLYIPIRGDYSDFQKDMARLAGIARQQGEDIANALNQAISPQDAVKGLKAIGSALKQLTAAAQSTGRTLNAPIQELDEFAAKANVARGVVEELHHAMVRTARDRQIENSLRTLQRQCGLTASAMARLRAEMGDAAGSVNNAMQGLGIRPLRAIQDEIREVEAQYQHMLEMFRSGHATENDVARAFAARGQRMEALQREAGTWQDPARASALRQRYDTLVAQAGRGRTSFAQFEARDTARNAVNAFQELNGRLPRPAEIRQIAQACGASAAQIRRMRDELDHSSNAFKALIGYAQVWVTFGFVHTAQDFIKTAMALDNVKVAFTAIYGSADMAEKKLEFVRQMSDKLGLSFMDTAEGAKKLFAAANGTPVEQHANMVFQSFSEMSAALKLTGDETKGVFLALSQMISKGKVSAEELRQQLAERMPGAVNLFAKSIGVTTQELDKMLQKGEVTLEHFVKFSAEVGKTYAAGAQAASHSLQAELNRLGNVWIEFQAKSTNTDALAVGIRQVNAVLRESLDIVARLSPYMSGLAKVAFAGWLASSLVPGRTLNTILVGLATSTKACGKAILAFAAATKAAILGAGSLKAAVKALGASMITMAKNPAFLALLATGVIAFKVFEDGAKKAESGFSDVSDSMDEIIKKRIELEEASKKSNFTPEFKRESLKKNTEKNFADWEERFAKMESSVRQRLDGLRVSSDDDGVYANKAEGYKAAFERLRAWEEEAKKAASSNSLDKINQAQVNIETGWEGLAKTLKDVYGFTNAEIDEIGKSAVKLDGYVGTAFANSSRILDTYAKETISAAKALGLNLDALKKTYEKLAKAASSTEMGKAFADMKNFNGLKEALGQTDMAFDHSVAVVGGYKDTIAGLAKDLAGANEKYDEAREKVVDMSLGFEDAGKQGNNYRAALDGLDKQTALVNQTQNEFINAVNNAINAAGGSGPAFSAMSDFIRQVGVQAGFTTDQINGFIDRLHAMRQAALAAINVKWAGDLEKQNIDREFQRQYKAERKAKNKAGMQKIREQHFAWKQGVSVNELSSDTKGQIGKSVGLDLADDADAEASRKGGRGGGGSKRVDNTAEKYQSSLEGFRKEIAKLRGETDKVTLDKKFADMDKQLKGSTADIKGLKKEYFEAFNANKVHELRKEIMQLTGDDKGLAELEIAEKMKAFRAEIDGVREAAKQLGVEAPEDLAKLGEAYEKALRANEQEQYLQKLIPIYEEIASKDEDKVKILELQNQLIGIQAEKMMNSFPPEVVERWREMQMLEHSRNPWDGIVLGLKKYSMETESLAKTMSSAVGQAFDGMADAFTQFVMTGKLSFKDMANSIIADLMRITVKSMILGPIANAIGGALGSLFSGASAVTGQGMNFSESGAAESASLGLGRHGHAKGDVFTGLHGYSNQIVSRPTLFSYGSQLTRFAKGGVMGEAGPEAVMPLTRMGNGKLGVQAAGGDTINLSLTIVDKTQGGVGVENTQAQQNGLKLDVIVQQIDSKLAGLAASGKSKFVGAMEKTHRMPSTRGW